MEIALQNIGAVAIKNLDLLLLADGKSISQQPVSLAIGQTLNLHLPWTPIAGTHLLALKLDAAQRFTQTERSMNNASFRVIVVPKLSRGADVAITALKLADATDQPATASVTMRNGGSAPTSGPLELRADNQLLAAVIVPPIPAGGVVTLPVPLPLGARMDSITAEFSPRDRAGLKHPEAALSMQDMRKPRDLRVEGLSLAATPPEPGRPRQATVSFRIVNHGKEALTAPFQTSISPGQVDTARRALAPFMMTSNEMAPGQTIYASRTVALPDELHEFDVRVETDLENSNKTGNAQSIATLHFKNPVADVGRWVTIGPVGVKEGLGANGVLFSIALDPSNPAIIYVGSHGSGVWKTADGGVSWAPITDSLPSLKIAALAVDPEQPARIYVATLDAGIFRSDDGGTSWSLIAQSTPLRLSDCCNTLIVESTNSNSLYLTSFDGVYHSANRGATWGLSLSGGFVNSLILDKAAGKLYASLENDDTHNVGNTGVYQLKLDETIWRRMVGCPGRGVLPTVTTATKITLSLSGSTLYAAFRTPTDYQLFRTTGAACNDSAASAIWEARWHPTGSVNDTAIPVLLWNSIYSDPVDPNFVYATGTYFWRSTDGGASFYIPDGGPHADDHGFAVSGGSPNTTYVIGDGGLYSSTDHGAEDTFKYRGRGITNMEYYDVAQAATDPKIVIGGTQDNGTQKYDSSSTFWNQVLGGDGATVAIDPTNSQNMYAMYQTADSIMMSTDGGDNWQNIATGLPTGHVCDNTPFQVHPKDASTLLASCGSLWRASPPGTPWSAIFTPTGESVERSAVDASIELYYAGTNIGNVYAGPSGANWKLVFAQPSKFGVNDIQVDSINPGLVYAAFGGSGAGRAFLLKRASSAPSSVSAVDITGNLPTDLSVKTLAVDPEFPFTIYAGTNGGVFRGHSYDGGTSWTWTSYNNGLPPAVIIKRLSFHPTSGVLRAGSYGRSAFEVNTDSPMGGLISVEGKLALLRVNDVGTGYGPPTDYLDAEVEVWLDSQPGRAFGFQLRNDTQEADHAGMLGLLREAFNKNRPVQMDVIRTGIRNARVLRVTDLPQ